MNWDFIDLLIRDLESSKQTKPITFSVKHGIPEELKGSRGVYIIKQVKGEPQAAFNEYNVYRENNENLNCPPLNQKPNHILYVGRHKDDIRKRLAEHLVKASDTTSALRLNEWGTADYEIDVYLFPDINPNLLQIIEACFAEQMQPAFGQHGKI
ncbi:hypothetical protein PH7735_02400 [Shimia thalassica]|uniref:GIY-YIG domain-containing protein n=1 Tax=Shimia thalassica TaxID=1715693 RepID=A0A0P1IA30_9RHOB|nr:GIY-YIG nuclease family protein [Shimia thalassica]CUK01006.1 hypothetical protein PH7735_02400 [Shimia thalassica]